MYNNIALIHFSCWRFAEHTLRSLLTHNASQHVHFTWYDLKQNKINILDKDIDIQIKTVDTAFDWHRRFICEWQWIFFVLPLTPLSSVIDLLANEFALCHFARQLSLSNLAHPSTSGERKRGVRSIDVNYADVTREGAHWSVSPPKESIKVRQLVFSPRFFFFLSFFQRFNNVTMVMDTASASPDKLSGLNFTRLNTTTRSRHK